jgi:hypothetical protein
MLIHVKYLIRFIFYIYKNKESKSVVIDRIARYGLI